MRKWLVLLLLALIVSGTAQAHTHIEAPVIGAWARAGFGVSAAYMTIENEGDHLIRLLSASSDAAAIVEIHQTTMEGEMMQMRPVEAPIEIVPGESFVMEPGGYHVMLLELGADLEAGTAISLTLHMEHELDGELEAFDLVVGAPVLIEPPAPSDWVVIGAWARPTAADPDHAEATQEATAEPMHTEATAESMHDAAGVSAIYMELVNRGAEDDTLISVSTDAAGLVEIHQTTVENDMMQMRPVEGGLPVAAGESVLLEPGGDFGHTDF
jgi:periplasmic copper chaperone A